MTTTILTGDCRDILPTLPAGSVQTCVTSPPYWQKRDYGHPDQIGQEATVEEYVANLVTVFREVRRVLADDGTLWLNLGSTYGKGKQMVPVPWLVGIALQEQGWILRRDNIWHKVNCLPESVKDRTTTAHEYILHFSKQETYYYDAAAIAEPIAESSIARLSQPNLINQTGSDRIPGKTNGPMKAVRGSHKGSTFHTGKTAEHQLGRASQAVRIESDRRNKRSVWSIPTSGYKDAHFAVMPAKLAEICILAGSREGDTILDPFAGSGTTLGEANRLGRHGIGIDLDEACLPMIERRTAQLQLEVAS